jgi:hypothetical protein
MLLKNNWYGTPYSVPTIYLYPRSALQCHQCNNNDISIQRFPPIINALLQLLLTLLKGGLAFIIDLILIYLSYYLCPAVQSKHLVDNMILFDSFIHLMFQRIVQRHS